MYTIYKSLLICPIKKKKLLYHNFDLKTEKYNYFSIKIQYKVISRN